MNDQDYIRKAVELADGWASLDAQIGVGIVVSMNDLLNEHPYMLDALAAQLVRQVDAFTNSNGYAEIFVGPEYTEVIWVNSDGRDTIADAYSPDRTLNTIKAIVDSKVLEKTQ